MKNRFAGERNYGHADREREGKETSVLGPVDKYKEERWKEAMGHI